MHSAHLLLLLVLCTACAQSPKQARRELVEMGYRYSREAFVECLKKEDAKALELFLLAGMDANAQSGGYSALEHAAQSETMVRGLLAAGADPEGAGGVSTPLVEAAARGGLPVVELLLAAGADPEGAGSAGETALMVAAARGERALVERLLAAGARVDARSRLGNTALAAARSAGHEEVVAVLVAAGASVQQGVNLAALMDPPALDERAPARFRAAFRTRAGTFVVEVERALAPSGADRFYNLVKNGFFDGQAFFRTVRGRLVQFGVHGTPEIAARWHGATLPDDEVRTGNRRGYLAYAAGQGPDSRTTQVFINLSDHADFDRAGFAPFGRVVEGMEVLDGINAEYGELPDQGRLTGEGNEYLRAHFPRLDYVEQARLVD